MSKEKTTTDHTADKKAPKTGETLPKEPEKGGPSGLDPTRYGDWERGGKCVDF